MKTTAHVSSRPPATHSPIWRIGRIPDTARAAKPIAAATIEAVVATNLFARVKT